MIKSQSKGKIPVLKNGSESDKQNQGASGSAGKSESVRPKLFGSKKSDKPKELEKSKSKQEKEKKEEKSKQKQKLEEAKEKEKKKLKKENEKKEKVKEKAEKEKKKLFKPPDKSHSKQVSKAKAKSTKSDPVKAASKSEPVVELIDIDGEEGITVTDVIPSALTTSSVSATPSTASTSSPNEPKYDVVGSPIRRGDNFLLKYQIKGDYLENKQDTNNGSSESSGTQPTPDSVQSFNPKDHSEKHSDNSEKNSDNSESSKADYSSPSKAESSSIGSGIYSSPKKESGLQRSRENYSSPNKNNLSQNSLDTISSRRSQHSSPRKGEPYREQLYEEVGRPHYHSREVMSDGQEHQYDPVAYGECPRSPSARSDPGVLEDTPAKPHRIRYGPGRRQVPRRHTLGADLMGGSDYEDPQDKRAAFMDLLANRYPQFADRIYSGTGTQSEIAYPLKQSRPRDPRRRQTTIVTYHPNRSLEYEDSGTMSDLDAPTGNSFTRGGFQRSSMPIVRTASSTLDRTLGLAFLVYGNETKKCLLPNEITTLDTVRALFVHHFPEKLTFEFLESPRQKIYILDPKTNIFFQLDDLSEIKDRTVLRIHECDSDKPQKLKEQPKVRGRAISAPPDRHYKTVPVEAFHQRRDDVPMQPYHTYMIDGEPRTNWEVERRSRSRSRTPDPERPKSLPGRSRYSPERHPTPERGLLGTIPEHHQMQNGRPAQNGGSHYEPLYYQRAQSQPTSPTRRPFSPNTNSYENPYYGYHGPPPNDYYPQHNGGQPPYVPKPKRQPQYATVPPTQPDMRNGSRHPSTRHSLAFAPMTTVRPQQDNYYQPPLHRPHGLHDDSAFTQPRSATPVPEYYHSKKRIDKMEEQLANLAAWVHKSATDSLGRASSRSNSSNASESTETLPVSSSSSLSGLSDSGSSQRTIVTCTKEMKLSMVAIREKTCNLRLELRGLRRAQQLNYEDICEAIANTLHRIKSVLNATPGSSCLVIRQQRYEIDDLHSNYLHDQKRLERELSDLEQSVEELRNDVVTRQCRVQITDIESMALLLSNITKSIADLKTRFPGLQEKMKSVMAGEMEVVVNEEKFLKDEPERIDSSLKRCKKLTGTLYTLKRLASVQDHRPINIPSVANKISEPTYEDKHGVLENIRAIVPNHTTRLNSLEEAESSRERKKKLIQQQESLKFGKSLELASKSLKPTEEKPKTDVVVSLAGGRPLSSTVPSEHQPVTVSSKVPQIYPQTASLPPPPPPMSSATSNNYSKPTATMSIPASPTTVANPEVAELSNQKQAARAAFFSSMSSPDTSPNSPNANVPSVVNKRTESPARSMDYVVKFSPAQLSSINSNSAPLTTSTTNVIPSSKESGSTSRASAVPINKDPLSPSSKQYSSIPRPSGKISPSQEPSGTKSDQEVPSRSKKPPPPPPPRKSSRLPMGSHNINGAVSPVRAFSPDGSTIDTKVSNTENKHPMVFSSTPKPPPAKKPVSKYQKDIVAGIYANMNRPDLQCQNSPPEKQEMPSRAETQTNVLSDREGSSDSTSSSASLDSQLGSCLLRDMETTGSNGSLTKKKKPKPNPPERRSSLLSKSPTRTVDSKTQILQDQNAVLKELQQQQNTMKQQHIDLVKSTNTPPPTLPKPTSPVSQNAKK